MDMSKKSCNFGRDGDTPSSKDLTHFNTFKFGGIRNYSYICIVIDCLTKPQSYETHPNLE